jgi:hypothetical protein
LKEGLRGTLRGVATPPGGDVGIVDAVFLNLHVMGEAVEKVMRRKVTNRASALEPDFVTASAE